MRSIKDIKKDLFVFITVSLLVSVFIMFNTPEGDDTVFHLYRLQGIKEALQSHTFPIYIYPYHNYGFGYACPLFYCDVFLLLPGLLYSLGIPIAYCYKGIIVLFYLLGNFFMMYVLRRIYKNSDHIVYIGFLLYAFSGIRLSDIFIRGALSSFMAYSFVPLIVLGIYELMIDGKDCWLFLGISFSLVLQTHLLTFLSCCICFLLIIIININNVIKKKKYKTIFKAVLIGVLSCSYYLFPFIEQMLSQKFWFNFTLSSNVGGVDLIYQRLSFIDIIKDLFHYSNYSYGIIPMSLLVLLFIKNKFIDHNKNLYLDILFIVSLLSSFLVWNRIDLSVIPLMYIYQFPWRPLGVLYFFVIFTICELLFHQEIHHLKIQSLIIFALYLFLFISFVRTKEPMSNDFDILRKQTGEDYAAFTHGTEHTRVAQAEYLPYTNSYDYYHASKNIVFANEDTYLFDFDRIGTTILFNTNLNYDEYVYMPLSWYKGYSCQELGENNKIIKELKVYPNEYNKRVGIYVEKGEHHYRVYYKGTYTQKISLFVTLASYIFIFLKKTNKLKCLKNRNCL